MSHSNIHTTQQTIHEILCPWFCTESTQNNVRMHIYNFFMESNTMHVRFPLHNFVRERIQLTKHANTDGCASASQPIYACEFGAVHWLNNNLWLSAIVSYARIDAVNIYCMRHPEDSQQNNNRLPASRQQPNPPANQQCKFLADCYAAVFAMNPNLCSLTAVLGAVWWNVTAT